MNNFENDEYDNYDYLNSMYDEPTQEQANFIIDKEAKPLQDVRHDIPVPHKVTHGNPELLKLNGNPLSKNNYGSNFFKPVIHNVNKSIKNGFIVI